ncbi:MAG: heme-binding protein [Halioglobus sp.]
MNRKSKITILAFIAILTSGFSHMASSIEEPRYELVQAIGDLEIRRYEPAIQAITVLPGESSSSEGFRRLAGFIFGGNEQEQSISMTAPVQETLGATTPTMAFTMPAEYTMEELPDPSDARVTLQDVPARTVAVVTFSGWATSARVARYERQLLEVLKANDIPTKGNSSLNQYNPPWTLPFLRRNEIMVEVKQPS